MGVCAVGSLIGVSDNETDEIETAQASVSAIVRLHPYCRGHCSFALSGTI